jgi:Cu+-exporting ATPase
MAKDPVCNMTVDESKSALKYDYKGKTYHFCSSWCLDEFKGHPDKFAIR